MNESKNWCVTDFALLDWKDLFEKNSDTIRYVAWGNEVCPKTGKKHKQGWLQLLKKKTRGGVKKLLKTVKVSLRACKGSELSNDTYCKKDGDFHTMGEYIVQGKRTDIDGIKKLIEDGVSMKEIAGANFHTYCRYHRAFDKYEQMCIKARTKEFRKVEVTIIQGPTGCGKTKLAVESNPEDYYKIQGDDLQWFDGYEQEKTLIIDEYDNQITLTKLLGILDGYGNKRLPIKGGFTYANWDHVIITTNCKKLHTNAKEEHRRSFKRRITTVVSYFKERECDIAALNISY